MPIEDIDGLQTQYAKSDGNADKLTLVISGEDCLVKTSLYKSELPRVDAKFKFMKMNIYVCHRPGVKEFLQQASK